MMTCNAFGAEYSRWGNTGQKHPCLLIKSLLLSWLLSGGGNGCYSTHAGKNLLPTTARRMIMKTHNTSGNNYGCRGNSGWQSPCCPWIKSQLLFWLLFLGGMIIHSCLRLMHFLPTAARMTTLTTHNASGADYSCRGNSGQKSPQP